MLDRKFLLKIAVAALGYALWSSWSAAQAPDARTVQTLYEDCKAAQSGHRSFCFGYLLGVGDLMAIHAVAARHIKGRPTESERYLLGDRLCGNYTGTAEAQAFINWAEKHPEKWTTDMLSGAVAALRETWPRVDTRGD